MDNGIALVTGSASGLGVQSVLSLAHAGYSIMINYRKSASEAERLKHKVEALGRKCALVQGDVSSKTDCQKIVAETMNYFGQIDVLVNNAGPYIFELKKVVDYTDEEWEMMIQGNLSSVFYMVREVIPIMRKKNWGRIITFGFNQSSQAAPWMYRGAYASAKVGLVSLTKTLAQEESGSGITVNMICPGDIIGENKEKTIEESRKTRAKDQAPVGRAGSGEDIGRVVRFLCSADSDFITGSVIEVNGGLDVLGKRGKGS